MRKILIVDDDKKIANLLKIYLENKYCEVNVAFDGCSAIKKIRQDNFDLVITDLLMPDKEGLELILEIKDHDPSIKIIAFSGGGIIDADECLNFADKFGADYVFSKPLPLNKLTDTVYKLIA